MRMAKWQPYLQTQSIQIYKLTKMLKFGTAGREWPPDPPLCQLPNSRNGSKLVGSLFHHMQSWQTDPCRKLCAQPKSFPMIGCMLCCAKGSCPFAFTICLKPWIAGPHWRVGFLAGMCHMPSTISSLQHSFNKKELTNTRSPPSSLAQLQNC